jgi:hypothetical protein
MNSACGNSRRHSGFEIHGAYRAAPSAMGPKEMKPPYFPLNSMILSRSTAAYSNSNRLLASFITPPGFRRAGNPLR